MNLIYLIAQAPPTTTPGQRPPTWFEMLSSFPMMLLLMFVLFYFFVLGGKRKEERKRTDMLNNLKKGDRIQTIGGIIGSVVEARDQDVLVKVDETTNTKIKFSRSAIHRVLDEEKTEAK